MYNPDRGKMRPVKVVFFAIVLIFHSSIIQAQESEGLVQKVYKKFFLKEKTVKKIQPQPSQTIPIAGKATGEKTKTKVYGDFYKNMSKDEMVREIKDEINSEESILEKMPEFKRQKDENGKYVYLYLIGDKWINIEDADEETLRVLIGQVNAKVEQARVAAVLEQQEQWRSIRSANEASRPPQPPPQPAAIPQKPFAPPKK